MKVLSILLALVNALMAGLILLSCISLSNLNWDGLGWLVVRITTGMLVILIGVLTLRDGMQPVHPGKILASGLALVLFGMASIMWGLHLTLISGDVKNVMILFGGSLVLQGVAAVVSLTDSQKLNV